MFKDNFKKELDVINPSAELETAVLNKICQEKELLSLAPKKSYKKRRISAVVTLLVILIVSVSVFNLPIFNADDYYFTNTSVEQEGQISNNSATLDEMTSELKDSDSNKKPSSTTSKNETEQEYTYPYIEKVEFPDIKYKKDMPTNITHAEAYQLAKAVYYKQTEHNKHSYDGTSSKLFSNKGDNSESS